jgi:hypothetical protein
MQPVPYHEREKSIDDEERGEHHVCQMRTCWFELRPHVGSVASAGLVSFDSGEVSTLASRWVRRRGDRLRQERCTRQQSLDVRKTMSRGDCHEENWELWGAGIKRNTPSAQRSAICDYLYVEAPSSWVIGTMTMVEAGFGSRAWTAHPECSGTYYCRNLLFEAFVDCLYSPNILHVLATLIVRGCFVVWYGIKWTVPTLLDRKARK